MGLDMFLWRMKKQKGKTFDKVIEIKGKMDNEHLTKIEKDGLITRKTHSTDKRSAYIYLTEKGLQMAHKVKEICFSIDDKALKNIPSQEQQHLLKTLNTIIKNLEEE